jgi:hypothetical protein
MLGRYLLLISGWMLIFRWGQQLPDLSRSLDKSMISNPGTLQAWINTGRRPAKSGGQAFLPAFLPDRNVWPPGLYNFAVLLIQAG